MCVAKESLGAETEESQSVRARRGWAEEFVVVDALKSLGFLEADKRAGWRVKDAEASDAAQG